jgi:hypothetical protein
MKIELYLNQKNGGFKRAEQFHEDFCGVTSHTGERSGSFRVKEIQSVIVTSGGFVMIHALPRDVTEESVTAPAKLNEEEKYAVSI